MPILGPSGSSSSSKAGYMPIPAQFIDTKHHYITHLCQREQPALERCHYRQQQQPVHTSPPSTSCRAPAAAYPAAASAPKVASARPPAQ
jgi:hypothetical protein